MLEKLTQIVRDYTGKQSIELTEDTVLLADLGLSSLDLVNLAAEIEDEFDIEIPDREIKNIKTVKDVIDLI